MSREIAIRGLFLSAAALDHSGRVSACQTGVIGDSIRLVLRADNGLLTGFRDGQSIGSTNYVLPVGKMEDVAGLGAHGFKQWRNRVESFRWEDR